MEDPGGRRGEVDRASSARADDEAERDEPDEPDEPGEPVGWAAAAADLFLGGRCVGCRRRGAALCETCVSRLPTSALRRTPRPEPPGLVPAYSAAVYEGVIREAVLAHKERGIIRLGAVLGRCLALAVAVASVEQGAWAEALTGAGSRRGLPVVLVPVPSRAAAVRQRGHDPTLTLCRVAARTLVGAGRPARVHRVLRLRPGVIDQAGLDRADRAANLDASMACLPGSVSRLAALGPCHLIVCDDVLTTGSTAREAQRALAGSGLAPYALATVAATARHRGRAAPGSVHG